jgi:hypothetical protein
MLFAKFANNEKCNGKYKSLIKESGMQSGTQRKISKIRPPRVQITYDVEIGGASKEKELPFVVGVIADLSADGGDPEQRC